MGVRLRNMAADAQQNITICYGGASSPEQFQTNWAGVRTSYQVHEFSVTVVNCTSGAETNGAETVGINIINNDLAADGTEIGRIVIADNTAYGSEFTTRDGTIQWGSSYKNLSDRVFAKGTIVVITNNAVSDAADYFAVSVCVTEFGAPPQ